MGGALVETLVLGPLLGRVVGSLEDVVVLLEEVVCWFLRPGDLPRGRPLLLPLLGCAGNRFGSGLWVSPSLLASCGCSVTTAKSSGSLGHLACWSNRGKLLRVSVSDGLDSSGAEVPEGDGIKLLAGV